MPWLLLAALSCTGDPDEGADTVVVVPDEPDPTEPPDPPDDTAPPVDTGLGSPVTESFTATVPIADFLFVVDASSSMWGYVDQLVSAASPLVNSWNARGIDFHAGATDIDDSATQGHLIQVGGARWASSTDPDAGTLLRQMLGSVGDPSTTEAGSLAAYRALRLSEPGGVNEGFLRDDSYVLVVVLSDEDDQSPDVPVSEQDIVDYLQALRPEPEKVGFHSIVSSPDYVGITNAVGGVVWGVTNTPYGPALDAITDTIPRYNVFTLAAEAVPSSIAVHVVEPGGDPVDLDVGDIVYDSTARTVDLDEYLPGDGAVVEITYVPRASD